MSSYLNQSVLMSGIAPMQVQPLASGLVEPHKVLMGPLLRFVRVSWRASHPSVSSANLLKDSSLLKFLLSIWDRSCPPVTDIKHNNADTRSRRAQSSDQASSQCWALLLWCWGVSSPICLAFSRTNSARLTPAGLPLSSCSQFAPYTPFRRGLARLHFGSALGCLFIDV